MLYKFVKPIYWHQGMAYCNIRVEKLREARDNAEPFILQLPEGFCKPRDPRELLKTGNKVKQVFLRPDEPMKMIGAYFELEPPEMQERIAQDPYLQDKYR